MNLTVLGSGSVIPRLKRAQAGYLVREGKKLFLFDCGAGALGQLIKAGVDYRKIDNIFVTHFHPDHVNELPAIIIANINEERPRKKGLNLFGPKGLREFYSKLLHLYPVLRGAKFKINIKELGNSKLKVGGLKISTIHTRHTENSIAYRIESKGKALLYSGDTGYGMNIARLAENAAILILECSFPNRMKKTQRRANKHLTPELCAEIATKANAKKLILTHIYPQADRADIKKETKKKFKGKVMVARDLMEVKI